MLSNKRRVKIGLWTELPKGARWTNEGVSRVVGFLIEGAAQTQGLHFVVVVPHGMARVVEDDLRSLSASEGLDWTVVEGPAGSVDAQANIGPASDDHDENMVKLANFANEQVDVAGWVVTFPFFTGSIWLKRPKAVLFPDAIPYDFPSGWPGAANWGEDGFWPSWFRRCDQVMRHANTVITFSRHVAERHLVKLFGVSESKIHVVPLAAPDLSPLVNGLIGRVRSPKTRREAADLLRAHSKERGWRYLTDFPFEEVDYAVVSTQDRPTKNLGMAAGVVLDVLRRRRRDLKLIVTAPLHFGAVWTTLPSLIERQQAPLDILSATDLPRKVHAALYHGAAVVIHPSFYEGIVGALPFFEAISVGTPAVAAHGPHTDELLRDRPEFKGSLFDPYDTSKLSRLIEQTLDAREDFAEKQHAFYKKRMSWSWGDVAEGYAAAAQNLAPAKPFRWQRDRQLA